MDSQLLPYLSARRWLIAFSGGLDSSVLLHLLQSIPNHPPIVAIHIHHGLQAVADIWPAQCEAIAAQYGAAFNLVRLQLTASGNVEERARIARYEALASFVEEGDCLFTAHHQDDQAETFLLRLLRGAGVRGLTAIQRERPFAKGLLVRPLLAYSRAELEEYATRYALGYVNDPSNQQDHYDRNYLRLQVLPLLQKRWPSSTQQICQTAQHLQESQILLDELAMSDLVNKLQHQWQMPVLQFEGLLSLSDARQKNAIRYWLAQYQITLTSEQWRVLMGEVLAAKADAVPLLQIASIALRRFDGKLWIDSVARKTWQATLWQTDSDCELNESVSFAQLSQKLDLELRPRQGGEKLLLRGQHKDVKKILQEARVPPWLRDQLPLVYYRDQLIAVADIATADNTQNLLGFALKLNCCPNVPARATI